MRRALALVLLAALLMAAPSAGAPAGRTQGCTAVTKRQAGAANVQFRIRCGFSVDRLTISSSRHVASVRRRTTLRDPDPEDRISCRRGSDHVIRCRGEAGEGVRIDGAFAVRGDPCAGLRARFVVTGGMDCDDPELACPMIGYEGRLEVKHPRGC